eukprot:Skav203434  [mRNA]  locus=scaffold727:155203:161604:+ [translate_table: standard]
MKLYELIEQLEAAHRVSGDRPVRLHMTTLPEEEELWRRFDSVSETLAWLQQDFPLREQRSGLPDAESPASPAAAVKAGQDAAPESYAALPASPSAGAGSPGSTLAELPGTGSQPVGEDFCTAAGSFTNGSSHGHTGGAGFDAVATASPSGEGQLEAEDPVAPMRHYLPEDEVAEAKVHVGRCSPVPWHGGRAKACGVVAPVLLCISTRRTWLLRRFCSARGAAQWLRVSGLAVTQEVPRAKEPKGRDHPGIWGRGALSEGFGRLADGHFADDYVELVRVMNLRMERSQDAAYQGRMYNHIRPLMVTGAVLATGAAVCFAAGLVDGQGPA